MKKLKNITFGLLIVAMIIGVLIAGAPQEADAKPTVYLFFFDDAGCASGMGVRVVVVDNGKTIVDITGCLA